MCCIVYITCACSHEEFSFLHDLCLRDIHEQRTCGRESKIPAVSWIQQHTRRFLLKNAATLFGHLSLSLFLSWAVIRATRASVLDIAKSFMALVRGLYCTFSVNSRLIIPVTHVRFKLVGFFGKLFRFFFFFFFFLFSFSFFILFIFQYILVSIMQNGNKSDIKRFYFCFYNIGNYLIVLEREVTLGILE